MVHFRRIIELCLILTFLILSLNATAERVALVIGNDRYESIPPLLKAGEDAKSMGAVLLKAGFRVTSLQNATYREIVKSVDKFSREIKPDDQAVFFFCRTWSAA